MPKITKFWNRIYRRGDTRVWNNYGGYPESKQRIRARVAAFWAKLPIREKIRHTIWKATISAHPVTLAAMISGGLTASWIVQDLRDGLSET